MVIHWSRLFYHIDTCIFYVLITFNSVTVAEASVTLLMLAFKSSFVYSSLFIFFTHVSTVTVFIRVSSSLCVSEHRQSRIFFLFHFFVFINWPSLLLRFAMLRLASFLLACLFT